MKDKNKDEVLSDENFEDVTGGNQTVGGIEGSYSAASIQSMIGNGTEIQIQGGQTGSVETMKQGIINKLNNMQKQKK